MKTGEVEKVSRDRKEKLSAAPSPCVRHAPVRLAIPHAARARGPEAPRVSSRRRVRTQVHPPPGLTGCVSPSLVPAASTWSFQWPQSPGPPGNSVEPEPIKTPTDSLGKCFVSSAGSSSVFGANAWNSSTTSVYVAEVIFLLMGWGQNSGKWGSSPFA